MGRLFHNGLFGVPVEKIAESLAGIVARALAEHATEAQLRRVGFVGT